jgi:hypothetical protein
MRSGLMFCGGKICQPGVGDVGKQMVAAKAIAGLPGNSLQLQHLQLKRHMKRMIMGCSN